MCNKRNMLIIVLECKARLTTVVAVINNRSVIKIMSNSKSEQFFPFFRRLQAWFCNWKQFQEFKLYWIVIYQMLEGKKRDSEVELTEQRRDRESENRTNERLNVTSSFRCRKMKTNHFLDRHRGAKARQKRVVWPLDCWFLSVRMEKSNKLAASPFNGNVNWIFFCDYLLDGR